jgi:hypothetical protein
MGRSGTFFNEDSIGKQTVIILTSVMIQSPSFKGMFLICNLFYIVLFILDTISLKQLCL